MRQSLSSDSQPQYPFFPSLPLFNSLFQYNQPSNPLSFPINQFSYDLSSYLGKSPLIDSTKASSDSEEPFLKHEVKQEEPQSNQMEALEKESKRKISYNSLDNSKNLSAFIKYPMMAAAFFNQQQAIMNQFQYLAAAANFLPVEKKEGLYQHKNLFLIGKEKKKTGVYSKEERMLKIKYYKEKKEKWRREHPINRGFIGRKIVAKNKPRVNGKFVKKTSHNEIKCEFSLES